jgi:hypothetical protein
MTAYAMNGFEGLINLPVYLQTVPCHGKARIPKKVPQSGAKKGKKGKGTLGLESVRIQQLHIDNIAAKKGTGHYEAKRTGTNININVRSEHKNGGGRGNRGTSR